MQIIDGKQVASQVLEEVERDIARLREQGITPGLAVVLVGEDPASQVYVNSKVKKCAELGMNSRKIVLPSDASQEELLRIVRELNVDPAVHGILVQSPPPPHIDEAAVVLEDVLRRGEAAVMAASARFDGVALRATELRVGEEELAEGIASVPESTRRHVREAHRRVSEFARRSLR